MRTKANLQDFRTVDEVKKDGTRVRARFTFRYGSVLIYDVELRSGPKGLKAWTPQGASIAYGLLGAVRMMAKEKLAEIEAGDAACS